LSKSSTRIGERLVEYGTCDNYTEARIDSRRAERDCRMGVMRFLVDSRPMPHGAADLGQAYISGIDGHVFPTEVEVEGNTVTCRRGLCDSGRLHIAWPIPGFGSPVLSTASLPEREEPYLLPLELARGKIAQLRDQVSAWEVAGMTVPAAFKEPFKKAHALLRSATAVQEQPAEAARLAVESLQFAMRSAEIVINAYTNQRLAARRKRSTQLPAALGCSLGQFRPEGELAALFLESFAAAAIPVAWKDVEAVHGEYRWELSDAQVEWCLSNRVLVYGGPLVDFSPQGLPEWLGSWSGSPADLQSFLCDYVETAAGRYAGRVRNWDVCARANSGGALDLSEEQRLGLVARALDVVRQVDNEVQIMLRIDLPWGEYQSWGEHRLSPLQFVDALLRAGIGLSAVNLEVAIGFEPGGSPSRDLLELSRLLDLWSGLGIPLHVTLACPSEANTHDPLAADSVRVHPAGRQQEWTEDSQAGWIDAVLPLLMAKQAVVGIFWSHFSDAVPHELPHAGLIRPDGVPKPAIGRLAAQRRTSWKVDSDPSLRLP
jgi:Glycosyl hydrolase family 10